MPTSVEFVVFQDSANCHGGKWIIRFKKAVSGRFWEDLVRRKTEISLLLLRSFQATFILSVDSTISFYQCFALKQLSYWSLVAFNRKFAHFLNISIFLNCCLSRLSYACNKQWWWLLTNCSILPLVPGATGICLYWYFDVYEISKDVRDIVVIAYIYIYLTWSGIFIKGEILENSDI